MNDPGNKYKKGEAGPLEIALYDNIAPILGPILHEKMKLSPNMITGLALSIGLTSVHMLKHNKFKESAILLIVRQIFDAMDGYVARKYNLTSKYGDLFDHYSDQFVTILIFYIIYTKIPQYLFLIVILVSFYVGYGLNERVKCVQKKNECQNKNIRHHKLNSSILFSPMELVVALSLFIYSLKYITKKR